MKKLLSVLLSIVLLVGTVVFPVMASETEGKLTLSGTSARHGDTVTLNIGLTDNPGIISMRLRIVYPEGLELVSVTDTGLLAGYIAPAPTLQSPYVLRWSDSLSLENNKAEGTIASLTFRVKDSAVVGDNTVSLEFIEANANDPESGLGLSPVSFGGASAAVHVDCTHEWGGWTSKNTEVHSRICGLCSYEETAEHRWNEGEGTKAPSCKEEGIRTFTCTVCGGTKTESIEKTADHLYGEWSKKDEAAHVHVCEICGASEESAHTWDEGNVTKAPSCKEEGIRTFTCTVCGETKTESIKKTADHLYGEWSEKDEAAHVHVCEICGASEESAHTWDEGNVTKAPSCKEEGIRTFACTACGETKEEPVSRTSDHKYTAWSENDGTVHKRVCEICGLEETQAHSWNAGAVTKEASCKEEGVKTFACELCGAERTETIPKTEDHCFEECESADENTHTKICVICGAAKEDVHSWNEGAVTENPTCKTEGIRTFTCQECGAEKQEPIPRSENHDFSAWENQDEDTHVRRCGICGAEESGAHAFGDWTVVQNPTCQATGVRECSCEVCGAVKTESIPKSESHDFNAWENQDEDTHVRRCGTCGAEESKAHVFGDWTVVQNPTCQATGVRECSCEVCGVVKTEPIPKSESHDFNAWENQDEDTHVRRCGTCGAEESKAHVFGDWTVVQNPTCQKEGVRECSCEVCGTVKTEPIPRTSGHSYDNDCDPDCNLCGEEREISHSFVRKADKDGHFLECSICGAVKDSEKHIPGDAADESHAQYCLVCGFELAPKQIPAENVQAGVSDGEGTVPPTEQPVNAKEENTGSKQEAEIPDSKDADAEEQTGRPGTPAHNDVQDGNSQSGKADNPRKLSEEIPDQGKADSETDASDVNELENTAGSAEKPVTGIDETEEEAVTRQETPDKVPASANEQGQEDKEKTEGGSENPAADVKTEQSSEADDDAEITLFVKAETLDEKAAEEPDDGASEAEREDVVSDDEEDEEDEASQEPTGFEEKAGETEQKQAEQVARNADRPAAKVLWIAGAAVLALGIALALLVSGYRRRRR